tara:strand:- start:2645 stop:3745 length:1101 start_codon:yes stop_codon:yes gene_type:complete
MYYSKTHQKLQILNDIDLLIILNGNFFINYFLYKKRIEKEVNKISLKYNIKQIDLSFRSIKMLKKSKFTIANYEIKNGYKNLYKNISLLDLMPPFDNKLISINEGKNYLFNRGSGLLIPLLYLKYFDSIDFNEQQWVNYYVETQKAIIAIGDCILIEKNLYHYSYLERKKRFKKISEHDFSEFNLLKNKYNYALEHKLMIEEENQSFNKEIPYEEMQNHLFEIIKIFEKYFIFFEQKRLNKKIDNWNNYFELVSKEKKDVGFSDLSRIFSLFKRFGIIKMLFSKNQRNQISKVSNNYLISILPFLLFSCKKDGFDSELVSYICNCLKVNFENNNLKNSWKNCVIKYLSIWHPEGESGRISLQLKDL